MVSIINKMKYAFLLAAAVCFVSCEEVVEVDLDSSNHQLVIDAEILWDTDTSGNTQHIYLSRLTDYYEEETIKVSNATVSIANTSGDQFVFLETAEYGTYESTNFIPELGETYTLTVIVEGETYTAEETMVPVPDITRIEQDDEGGFLGDEIEVSFYFDDPADETNFYLTDFETSFLIYPEYDLSDDDFFNGNEMDADFSDEDLAVGDAIQINFRGISEQFYNYMSLILESTSGNPFSTPPANIRGNIINQTNAENYAFGYFSLSQAHQFVYTVE